MSIERRGAARQTINVPSKVVLQNGRSKPCVIVNESETGAKLSLSRTVILPSEFSLALPHRGRTRLARLVWRRDEEAGVCFV